MSTDTREDRFERRIAHLYAADRAVRRGPAQPGRHRGAARPGLRLPQIVRTVMEGYADRPALGQRAIGFVTDPATGRTAAELLPRFDTITYRETGDRVPRSSRLGRCTTTGAARRPRRPARLRQRRLRTVDMALSTWARSRFHCRPARRYASCSPSSPRPSRARSPSSLDPLADAVELALTGHTPDPAGRVRLPPGGRRPARGVRGRPARLRRPPGRVETLNEVIERGRRCRRSRSASPRRATTR